MNTFAFLLADQNIPFLVALGCCIILALIQVVAGFGDADADAAIDVDADTDIDIEAESAIDIDANTSTLATPGTGPLSALGIGKVPFMLVLMSFLGCFGAIGLLGNSLMSAFGAYPAWGLVAMLVASVVLAVPLTGTLSRGFTRFAPRSSTAVNAEQLVGRVGVVVSPAVTTSYGRVAVRDMHGTLHTVYAMIDTGEAIPEHSEVALVRYEGEKRYYLVRRLKTT
jgi:membrane protein implicated in regulation of membrane protease activity